MAVSVLVALILPLKRTLSISNHKNILEKVYSTAALNQGFVISYTHSVNKGRVYDYYRCLNSGRLELYSTHFVSYGAGIPEPYETAEAKFTVKDDGYIIEDLHRVLPCLFMAVGLVAEHSFSAGGNEVFLKDFFNPQTSIVFEVKRVSILDYLITKKI